MLSTSCVPGTRGASEGVHGRGLQGKPSSFDPTCWKARGSRGVDMDATPEAQIMIHCASVRGPLEILTQPSVVVSVIDEIALCSVPRRGQ
jgi:hypothetical protein